MENLNLEQWVSKKDLVFFGTEGCTSTSMNHLCNMAKESYRGLEQKLANMNFYKTDMSVIGSSERTPYSRQMPKEEFEKIPEYIRTIGSLKAFIAYGREAIKARKKMLEGIDGIDEYIYVNVMGIEMPRKKPATPVLTESEYYGTLNLKERNEYYTLEAQCATLGDYIHEHGAYANARHKYTNILTNPVEVIGSGRDTIIYNSSTTISPEDVEKQFFELQSEHRAIQARLNAIKHKCELAIQASKIEALGMDAKNHNDYRAEMDAITDKTDEIRHLLNKEISSLKIVIPNHLLDIYKTLNEKGK